MLWLKNKIIEVPINLLYSQVSNPDDMDGINEDWNNFKSYREDIPVINFTEHSEFIQFCIDDTKGSIKEYIEWWENLHTIRNLKTPLTKKEYFLRRKRFINLAIRKGPIKALNMFPVLVENFGKDHFNIRDGHHRVILAHFFSLDYIKAEVPQKIYKEYLLRSTKKIHQIINEQNRKKEIEQPIDIPGYYHLNTPDNCCQRLKVVRKWLGGTVKGCQTVFDIEAKIGYYCHHFTRQGLTTMGIEENIQNYKIALTLNKAYGLEARFKNIEFQKFSASEKFDITLSFNYISKIKINKQKTSMIEIEKKIGKLTRRYLFWESRSKINEEKKNILRNGGFREYKKLANSFVDGKIGEIGVFIK